jgi:hypothetical protein
MKERNVSNATTEKWFNQDLIKGYFRETALGYDMPV